MAPSLSKGIIMLYSRYEVVNGKRVRKDQKKIEEQEMPKHKVEVKEEAPKEEAPKKKAKKSSKKEE